MKKTKIITLLTVIALIGLSIYLYRSYRIEDDESIRRDFKFLITEANELRKNGRWPEIIKILDKAVEMSRGKNTSMYLLALEYQTYAYSRVGNMVGMLHNIETILDTEKPDSLIYREGNALLSLVDFHAVYGQLEQAKQFNSKARRIAEKCNTIKMSDKERKELWRMIYFVEAQFAIMDGDLQKAVRIHDELKKVSTDSTSIEMIGNLIALQKGDTLAVRERNKRLLTDSDLYLDVRRDVLITQMDIFNKMNMPDSAIALKRDFIRHNGHQDVADIYLKESEAMELKGNYAESLSLYRHGIAIRDSLNNSFHTAYSLDIADRFDAIKQKKELKKEHQSSLIKTAVIILMIVLTIGLIQCLRKIALRYRMKDEENATNRLRLGTKISEFSSVAESLKVAQSNERSVREIMKSDIPERQKLIEIKRHLTTNPTSAQQHLLDEDSAVQAEFTSYLHILHPDLSKAELRIAPMIAMGWSNKEIASYLNRSPATIKCTKYRMHKKLKPTEDLYTYLVRIRAQVDTELHRSVSQD